MIELKKWHKLNDLFDHVLKQNESKCLDNEDEREEIRQELINHLHWFLCEGGDNE